MNSKRLTLIAAATLMGYLFNTSQLRATPVFTPGITEIEGPTYTPTHYVWKRTTAGTVERVYVNEEGMGLHQWCHQVECGRRVQRAEH